ncbi:MAG: acyltransferase family protein [Pseudorhodoplanes sp.]
MQQARTDWVDYAKGISIILVVMMHSTLSSEEALHHQGWLHEVVAFAKPFRIPAFFMIAGLFVSRTVNTEWRSFLDRKILHFVYFYVLWLTIQFVFRTPGYIAEGGVANAVHQYLLAFIDPYGTLWFIYMLPVFFLVTRLTRNVPPALMLLIGAALEIAPIDTQWTLIDEFAGRFVYFYAGYVFSAFILGAARQVETRMFPALAALACWFALNLWLVKIGLDGAPFVSLFLGFIGAAAVVMISVMLAQAHLFEPIRYCGQNSIVIYLAFFLPMAATRTALVKSGWITDPGTVSAIVTLVAVTMPVLLYWLVRGTSMNFLFERPEHFRLIKKRAGTELQPAE